MPNRLNNEQGRVLQTEPIDGLDLEHIADEL